MVWAHDVHDVLTTVWWMQGLKTRATIADAEDSQNVQHEANMGAAGAGIATDESSTISNKSDEIITLTSEHLQGRDWMLSDLKARTTQKSARVNAALLHCCNAAMLHCSASH